MKWLLLLCFGFVLTGCAPLALKSVPLPAALGQPDKAVLMEKVSQSAMNPRYPDLGLAPELKNEVWLNTDHALRMNELRGKVVLLEMWTFGCINCQNVMPSLRDWHSQYQDQGLVIIGNHFPEFPHEKELTNLKNALQRLDIKYAVTQDNDGKTWSAYNNLYWPTLYLIDKRGHIRYTHIGEGNYRETEMAIQDLLNESN